MRRLFITTTAVLGLGLTVGGTPAMAGYCGQGPQGPVYKQNCNIPVHMMPGAPAVQDPVVVHTSQPMGHLRSIKYHGAPHVNVTRIHGLPPTVGLGDVPIKFTGGCNPTSTTYCRRPMGHVAPAPVSYRAETRIVSATMTPPPPPPPPPPAPVISQPLSIAVAPPPPPRLPPVVCRPPEPPRVQVVRPVIGVPVPVPTPLPPIGCFGGGSVPAPVISAPHYNDMNAGLAGGPPSHRFSSVGY